MFKPEDKVFAKVRGYPFWPAKITALLDETPNKVKYSVYFYGSREVGVCKGDDVCDYIKYREKHGNLKRKFFPEAMREIEEELEPELRRSANVSTIAQKKNEKIPTTSHKKIENVPTVAQKKNENVATIAQKSKSVTPKNTPRSARNKANESVAPSGDETPVTQTPPQEVTSRSGRKIKPKKFSDGMVLPSPRVTKTSLRGKSLVTGDTPKQFDLDFDMATKLDESVCDTSVRMASVTSEQTATDSSMGEKVESTPDTQVKNDSIAKNTAMVSDSAKDDSAKEQSAMDSSEIDQVMDPSKSDSAMDASVLIDPAMELDKMNSTMDLEKIDSAMDLDKIDSAMEMDKIDLEMELAKIDAEMELSKEDTATELDKMDAEMDSAESNVKIDDSAQIDSTMKVSPSPKIDYATDKSLNVDLTNDASDNLVDKVMENEDKIMENDVKDTENDVKDTEKGIKDTEGGIVDATDNIQTDVEKIVDDADISKTTDDIVTDKVIDAQANTELVSPVPDSSSRKRSTIVSDDTEASADGEIADTDQNEDADGETDSTKLLPPKKRKTDDESGEEKVIVNGYGGENAGTIEVEEKGARRGSKKSISSRSSHSQKSDKEILKNERADIANTSAFCSAMEEAARLELKLVEATLDLKRNMTVGNPNFDKATAALEYILSEGMNKYALLRNDFVVDAVLKMTNFDVAVNEGNDVTNLKDQVTEVGDGNPATNSKDEVPAANDGKEITNLKEQATATSKNEATAVNDGKEITNSKEEATAVGDGNPATNSKDEATAVNDGKEITNLKEQATLIREKANAIVSKMRVLFDADEKSYSYFIDGYRVARKAYLANAKSFKEFDFYRLVAGQEI